MEQPGLRGLGLEERTYLNGLDFLHLVLDDAIPDHIPKVLSLSLGKGTFGCAA